jgi:Nucleotidyl transferase AbiEii toxin, Type IV TA system
MPLSFEPQLAILPSAQKELWPQLAAARTLSFVLYGGTAVALYLGHRTSLDFDFFALSRSTKSASPQNSASYTTPKPFKKTRRHWLLWPRWDLA